MIGYEQPLPLAHLAGYGRHLRVLAATIGIRVELADQIALIQPRDPRDGDVITCSIQPMTGKAGTLGARPGTAQGYKFARSREPVRACAVVGTAA